MSDLERIEADVQKLTPDELATFRRWFISFDAEHWDQQLEEDVAAGKLDSLRDEALADHAQGRTRDL
jgi:hypothetical protein